MKISKEEKIRRWADQYDKASKHLMDPKLYEAALRVMNLAQWKIFEALSQ